MKTIHTLIISVLLTAISLAGEPLKFETLENFLTWADAKLRSDDYEGFASAQVANKDIKETRISYIKKLDADLGIGSLSQTFKGKVFPADKHIFKLGGHNKELGHCHIDFVKVKGGWQLARVWQCR